ncbi:MAG: hypothetical protein ACLPPV_20840 [Candidatus Korobacteraceae bacterium]|jgi:hypothetical protein
MPKESKAPRIAALLAQIRKFIAGVIAFNQRIAEEFNLSGDL